MPIDYGYPTAFTSWGEEEMVAMERVHASGRYTMGAEVEAFEAEFAAYHGMKYAVMVNSGSSANLIAVAALFHLKENPLQRGNKVVVPALAWPTTYAPLVQHGLNLVLADCDDSWNANEMPEFQENDIHAIVAVSVLGVPCDLTYWDRIAKRNNAWLIEDNCESLGASIAGRKCGTFGIMSTASFFYSHQLSAIEGGAVLTDSRECYELCRLLRNHGWLRGYTFESEYDFRLMGYNVRPLELHAAVAREQLKKLDVFKEERLKNRRRWIGELTGRTATIGEENTNPFAMKLDFMNHGPQGHDIRAKVAKAFRANGIDCRPPAGGSFTRHVYGQPWRDQKCPNADRVHDTGLLVGLAPFDISDKIAKAAKILKETINARS